MSGKNKIPVVATTAQSAIPNVRRTTKVVWTYIYGNGIQVDDSVYVNYPWWFWWLFIACCLICFISCVAWLICALFFFKREKPCTHKVHVVIEKDAGSPKKEDDRKNDPPQTPQESAVDSFTKPLTPPGAHARSSKRSSRKEEEKPAEGGQGSRKSSKEPDSRKSSKKSGKSGSKKSSKKSQKSRSKKSGKSSRKSSRKSERADGGKDICIQMDSDDIGGAQSPNLMKYGFFEKISRSMFFSRDL